MTPDIAPIRRALPATLPSPWRGSRFVDEGRFVLEDATGPMAASPPAFELAGPRREIALDASARAAILTAGGLCPGVNDVVRALVLTLWHGYGLRTILGVKHGFDGLAGPRAPDVVPLSPDVVRDAHQQGGTALGTARGEHDMERAADSVESLGLAAVFCIGGDGTLKGALALDGALQRRGVAAAVVGVPKTIDNDVPHCSRTFGFVTAVEEASRAISAAHAEARAHRDGIAIVQLMGRESGFIAAASSLACPDVNFCLVPESPFTIRGLVRAVRERLAERGHAVVVVAEGAGESLWSESERAQDASGNVKLPAIGPRLQEELARGLAEAGLPPTIKRIDPSYMIRSVVADPDDRILCIHLAQAAAHAAMSGRSALMVGLLGDSFAHVPLQQACAGRKRVDLQGELWQAVLASTGQPELTD
jgi:6-phosphofructokinase 1